MTSNPAQADRRRTSGSASRGALALLWVAAWLCAPMGGLAQKSRQPVDLLQEGASQQQQKPAEPLRTPAEQAQTAARTEGANPLDAYSPEQIQLMVDFITLLKPVEAAELAKATGEKRKELLLAQVGGWLENKQRRSLLPVWLEWARKNLDEGGAGKWVTDRTVVLVALGPPGGVHRSPKKSWTKVTPQDAATPWDLMLRLAGKPPVNPAPEAWDLEGDFRSEAWVYPYAEGKKLRVLWFVDADEDGRYKCVLDQNELPETEAVSDAPKEELPAELFGQVAVAPVDEGQKMPELKESPLTLTVDIAFFKAAESRTLARFSAALDPTQVELELDAEPAAWFAEAMIRLRVDKKDGQPVFQDGFMPTPGALSRLSTGYLDELVGVPMVPGDYTWTVVAIDKKDRGGSATGSLSVPDMTGPIAMSSVVLALAEGEGEAATLPLASAEPADPEAFEPFKIGKYIVRPHSSRTFRPGETLALVTQVYNAASATIEYDLWQGATLKSSLDEAALEALPTTDIQLITVTEAWPAGTFRFVVTATASKSAAGKVVREVEFKVRR